MRTPSISTRCLLGITSRIFPDEPLKVPRDHLDLVAFLDVKLDPVHNTSGASETIFMKLRSRSSRATGPKMRVPRGFRSLSMITIALLSKRRSEPSSRRDWLPRPHQNRAHHFALLHRAGRARFFHVRGDHVADAGVKRAPCRSRRSSSPSARRCCPPHQVWIESVPLNLLTSHFRYFWSTSTSRHRFNLLSGRVSMIRTVSPVFALFSSSCA